MLTQDPGYHGFFSEIDQQQKQHIVANKLLYRNEHILKKIVSSAGLHRLDRAIIPNERHEIRLFSYIKNESLRLPFFLKYYLDKGVDRVFLIDNNSVDNSVSIALSFENVHVFQTKEQYKNHWNWVEILLNRYGMNYWCLLVDADELLHFPSDEDLSIRNLCDFLEEENETVLRSLLIDLYADMPISDCNYQQNMDPLTLCPYFDVDHYEWDAKFINKKKWSIFSYPIFGGGMRGRVFGFDHNNIISKTSLFRYQPNTYITQGIHGIDQAITSSIQGVVFHTKLLQDFENKVGIEVKNEQYSRNSYYYKEYQKILNKTPSLSPYYEGSMKYRNSRQLVDLGLMKSSEKLNEFSSKFSSENLVGF